MKKILILSQENFIGKIIQSELMKEGYRVNLADVGKRAVGAWGKEIPDLVLVDTVLSDFDHPDILHALQERDRSFPVVVWSGADSDENRWGPVGAYVMKTSRFSNVKRKIRELVFPIYDDARRSAV